MTVKGKVVLVIFIGIIALMIIYSMIESPDKTQSASKEYIQLKSQIAFTGSAFEIRNDDNFDWKDVRLEINFTTFKKGYIYRMPYIAANEELTIDALNFAGKDGTRFNPYQKKPLNFRVACQTPEGKGIIYFNFN